MKIGLIDVDGHNFPNLALMKISTFHKKKNDQVEFVQFWQQYDRVYKSKVFTFSKDVEFAYFSDEIIEGGTGYDVSSKLPDEIENCDPDYSIYPEFNYAVGYLTRGCPRNCPFCIVGEKEGFKSYQVAKLESFWKGQKEIKLLDPNLTACKNREKLLFKLSKTNAKIDFTQGLDIRFMTNDLIDILLKLKVKRYHFAYDRMNESNLIEKNLINFVNRTGFAKPKFSNVSVFVLTNYETTFDEDLYRIYFIRSLGISPYVMIYEKHKLIKGQSDHFKLQRWVNNQFFFWKYKTFEDYLHAYSLGKCV